MQMLRGVFSEIKNKLGKEIEMTEEEKRNTDVYLRLMEIQQNHFESTRDIEWKVNLSFWTLIALTYQFSIDSKYKIVVIGCATMFHYFWMRLIDSSENKDLKFIYFFRSKCIESITKNYSGCKECFEKLDKIYEQDHLCNNENSARKWFWILLPVFVTLVLLLIVLSEPKQFNSKCITECRIPAAQQG